jgi:heme exporter protein B
MWRDTLLMVGKDLRIEARSRVALSQVAPFGVIALVLFAFALGPDRSPMAKAAPGLFWVAVLFSALLAIARSFALESADGARDGLRMWGLDPAGVFLGKAAAVAVQLVALEVLLGAGIVFLFGTDLRGFGLLISASVAATVGLAASGTVYGMMAAGLRVRETLLPLLMLPVVAPVLLGATEAWRAALALSSDDGWRWLTLLGTFALIYCALGVLGFGALMEGA